MLTPALTCRSIDEYNFKRIALCCISSRHAGGRSRSSRSICCELAHLRRRLESWSRAPQDRAANRS